MTAHISFPVFEPNGDPSTLSTRVLTGLLREELGFRGVIATDSLRMEGVRTMYSDAEIAVRALEAGADVLLDPQQPTVQIPAVIEAVRTGRLTEQRIDASVRRVLAMKWDRGVIEGPYVEDARIDDTVGIRSHLEAAQRITDQTPTLVTDDADLVPLPAGSVLVTGFGDAAVPQLASGLRRTGRTAHSSVTGAAPTQAAIDEAVRQARRHDLVVVTTSAAWKSDAQKALVAALRDTGTPVLVVALRDPYDIAHLPGVTSYLATYSSTWVSIESVVRILAGSRQPRGRLPVDIPSADDPGTLRYPFGTGLTS